MKKESMLIVEDEQIMREALFDYFSSEGHSVDTASDGDEALKKFQLEDYDAMIIDLLLPGRDGLSVLKEAKEKNPKAKIIIITAYPTYESEMEARRRGAIEYLQKPFELSELESLIKETYADRDVIPVPLVEEPLSEEDAAAPCIWTQAGIVQKRLCTRRYLCDKGCNFHTAMMKKEKFRNDPRIQPFLTKLTSVTGRNQCRYTMSGHVSYRSCPWLYYCDKCEFDQVIQDKVDRQLGIRAARRRRTQAEGLSQIKKMYKTAHSDN